MSKRRGGSVGVAVAGVSAAVGRWVNVGFRLFSGVDSGVFVCAAGPSVWDTCFTTTTGMAVGSVERAGVHVGAGVVVAVVVVPAGATASEAWVGAGVAVDMGAEGTAVGCVEPAHAVTTNSVRKTNPPR